MPSTNLVEGGMTLADLDAVPAPPDAAPPAQDHSAQPPPVEAPKDTPVIEDDDETPEPTNTGTNEPNPDDPVDLTEAMNFEERNTERAKKKEAEEAEKKKADEAAAKPAEVKDPKAERDADLAWEPSPHTREKTGKIIRDFQAKAKAARDERDAIIAEREAIKKERDDFAAKVKSAEPPKELTEKLKQYEERIRELDISKDPAIEAKYDRRIEANTKSIVDVLKQNGYGQVKGEDGKYTENPRAIPALLKSGLTFSTLKPLIDQLEKNEQFDDAEAIRDAIRENVRLAKERQGEIESWKGNYESRIKAREQQTQQESEARQKAFDEHTQTYLRSDLEALAKDFPSMKPPPAPQPSDPPAVAKAKQAALDEFNAAKAKIDETVKGFNVGALPKEKHPEAVGRINSHAIQAVVLKTHVLPGLLKERAALQARIKELEAKDQSRTEAGRISRLQSGAPAQADRRGGSYDTPRSLEEAFGAGPA